MKISNIVDDKGKEWTPNEVYEFYRRVHVMPLVKSLELEISEQLLDFEKTTGISVFLSPILVWGQAYREGCELILKSPLLVEEIYSLE